MIITSVLFFRIATTLEGATTLVSPPHVASSPKKNNTALKKWLWRAHVLRGGVFPVIERVWTESVWSKSLGKTFEQTFEQSLELRPITLFYSILIPHSCLFYRPLLSAFAFFRGRGIGEIQALRERVWLRIDAARGITHHR